MANIKFSQFTVETAKADVDFLVGYSGPDNVQISHTNLLADYPAGSGAAGQVTFFSAASTVTGDNDFYWDNTNKRLGIGTTSPDYNLHVKKASTNTAITIEGSTNAGANFSSKLNFSNKGISGNDIDFTIGLKKTNNLVFMGDAAANELMRIEGNTGDVGIGTATPVAKLHVEGSFISSGISQLGTTGANVLLTSSSAGNVGIGTTSPAYKLDVSGSLRATGESTFTNNLLFPDNSRIKLGTGEDLQIYHDGSNSYIQDASGTGDIRIASNIVHLNNAASTEVMLKAIENGAVELYYNDNKKLETTTDGATILGGTGVNTLSRLRVGGEGAGNNKSILELVEHIQGTDMHYGFSFTCDGDGSNNLLLRRHQNSVTGSTVMTVNRGDDNVTFEGDVEIANSSNGIILESPDGTRYRVTVANGGTLSVSAV